MDILSPLETFYEWHPEHSATDQDRLMGEMVARQDALHKLLRGEVGLDYVCDLIAQQGYGIDEWMAMAIDNLDYAVASGLTQQVERDDVETLITLPRYGILLEDDDHEPPTIWIPD